MVTSQNQNPFAKLRQSLEIMANDDSTSTSRYDQVQSIVDLILHIERNYPGIKTDLYTKLTPLEKKLINLAVEIYKTETTSALKIINKMELCHV